MSPWEIVALCLACVVATLLLVYVGWHLARSTEQGGGHKEFGQSWDVHVDDEAPEEMPALKIDPENPPSWKIYNPPPGRQAPPCNCHGRPIQRGENILMWPDPEDPGAFRLFHEDFVNSLGAGL